MSISKLDVLNKTFSSRAFGYSKIEVEQFMQELAEVLGQSAEEKKETGMRLRELEARLNEYMQREETLRDTLVTTQKMVDDLKKTARKESQLIISEAQAKADAIVQQAHNRAAQVHGEVAELKRQRARFEMELRQLLEGHMQMLEYRDPEMERVEELESKLKYLKQAK